MEGQSLEALLTFQNVVVVLLIIIVFYQYKMSAGYTSMFKGGDASGLAYLQTLEQSNFVGSGAAEAPSFWNMGSAKETAAALSSAAAKNAADAAASGGQLNETSLFNGGRSGFTGGDGFASYNAMTVNGQAV